MIVGTHFGLFMPALRPDWKKCVEDGEPELQVRSRRKIDLLNLRQLMTEHALFISEVIQLPHTDYQFRAYCTREDWGRALVLFADDIDYTKFKDTPEKKHGDKKLTDAYSAIWSATLRSFPTGSIYSARPRHSQTHNIRVSDPRVVETVYRTEKSEWRMKGADPRELADLMREIDAATDGVELPSEDELEQVARDVRAQTLWVQKEVLRPLVQTGPTEINGHLDHSKCTHGASASARRKCRKRFYRDN